MSSFICSPKHFNSVERALLRATIQQYPEWNLYDGSRDIDKQQALIREHMLTLRELSALCVNLQYKHHHQGELDEVIQADIAELKNASISRELSLIELHKACSCISYQIETEHLEELRPLTGNERTAILFLESIKTKLALHIIKALPEYDKAEWEIK